MYDCLEIHENIWQSLMPCNYRDMNGLSENTHFLLYSLKQKTTAEIYINPFSAGIDIKPFGFTGLYKIFQRCKVKQ